MGDHVTPTYRGTTAQPSIAADRFAREIVCILNVILCGALTAAECQSVSWQLSYAVATKALRMTRSTTYLRIAESVWEHFHALAVRTQSILQQVTR